jgi:hypothetical protein
MDKDTGMDKKTEWIRTQTWNWNTFEINMPYSSYNATWVTCTCMTHHSANPNGAINLQHHFLIKIMTCKFS